MPVSQKVWDAIVVGTGPSGAATARELSRKHKQVLILEKGHLDFSLNVPRMLKNKEMLFIGKGRTLVSGVRTGGSSILYYGSAYQPPHDIFSDYGIDLSAEIAELKQELPIAPLKDALIGPAAQAMMRSATGLGYPWKKLDKFIYQDLCDAQNFPFEAQWNATRFLNEAVENGAKLVNGAAVQRIALTNGKACGVEYWADGQRKTVYANVIILSAGGVGSPQILQATGLAEAGNGFFCDPLVIVQGEASGIQTGKEITMAAGALFEKEGFMLSDLTLPKRVYQLFTAQSLRLHRISHHTKTLGMMVKIKDRIGGRIGTRGNVYKDFAPADHQKMQAGVTIAREILAHAGAKKIYQTAWTSAHPGGSVRIGELVDSNLQTAYKNLYVCDCSVIPFDWGLPPTFTLLSLAKRLAKHILGESRRS